MHRDKVAAWTGVRFFVFNAPGTDTQLLYAPTSFQIIQLDDEECTLHDPTKTLVMVLPKGAMARVTDPDRQPMVTAADDHDTHADVMMHDLRKDILYMAHNNLDHPSLSHTIRNVRELCWFPKMIRYIRDHYDMCPICMPKMKIKRAVGGSILAARRLHTLYIDHYILTDGLPSITGVPAILTVVCASIRLTMFEVVADLTAAQAVRTIHNQWYSFFGIPKIIKSDNGSAFVAELMQAYRTMMGVKRWNFSAADDPTHHSLLENKHKVLDDVLMTAHRKSDIKSEDDLRFYTKNAMARQNLYLESDGFTPHEKLTGQRPYTVTDMITLSAPSMQKLKPMDQNMIETIKEVTEENMKVSQETRAERVRRNVLTNDVTLHKSRQRTTDIRVGDEVSYRGVAYKVTELKAHTPSGPSKAAIQAPDGATQVVKYHDLTGLAEPTPELMLEHPSAPITTKQFVFFTYKEDSVEGGTVTKVTPDLITIHIMRPAPKKKKLYSHLWRLADSALPLDAPFEDYERASWGVKPHSSSPVTVAVKPTDIIVAGEIAKGYINQKMLDHLKSMGIIV